MHDGEHAAETGTTEHSFSVTVLKALDAPFVGLALFLGFPVIGLAIVARCAAEAVWERRGRIAKFMKDIGLFFAAPFIGLIYAVAFPVVGVGFLAARGVKALIKRRKDEVEGLAS